jgi:hypothetical protein
MIIHTGSIGNGAEHGADGVGYFAGRHAWAKLCRFRGLIRKGFHRKVQHNLVPAAVGVLSNIGGVGMIRQNRQGQRIVESENALDDGRIAHDIIEDDRQASGGNVWLWRSYVRDYVTFGGTIGVQKGLNSGFDFAAARRVDGADKRETEHNNPATGGTV